MTALSLKVVLLQSSWSPALSPPRRLLWRQLQRTAPLQAGGGVWGRQGHAVLRLFEFPVLHMYPGEFANPYFPRVQLEVKVQLVTWIRIITVCSNWNTSRTALPAMASPSPGGKSGRQQKEAEDYLSKIELREIFQVAHMLCIHTKYPILLNM